MIPKRGFEMTTLAIRAVSLAFFGALCISPGCESSPTAIPSRPVASFILWQLPSQTPSQIMSYVLQTGTGSVIVIDGGNTGDAPYLRGFLAPLGNRVCAWFISHPHPDHVDALTAILEDPQGVYIASIFASMPEELLVAQAEPEPATHLQSVKAFNHALKASGRPLVDLSLGQDFEIDGVRIEIIGIKNPEITENFLNNSSVMMRVMDSTKSVLFTGDLGIQGGQKLLNSRFRDRLRADYAQMAHHGQHGVDEDFYRAVKPKYCLWPTPRWLWDNDKGEGKGSGEWDTLRVRSWMKKLKVQRHYLSADGLCRID